MMPFSVHTCHSAECDGCGDGWEEGVEHFDSLDALNERLRYLGWMVTDEKALCPQCAVEADCAATGHRWDVWEPRQMEGVTYLSRDCEHCMRGETDPPFFELSDLVHAARTINGITGETGRG
jgi:hypothetical protein